MPVKILHFLLFTAALFCLVLTSFEGKIPEKQKPVIFKPTTFYVAKIINHQVQTNPGSSMFNNLLYNNVAQDTSLKPVQIEVKEFDLTENTGKTGIVEGEIKIQLSFSLAAASGEQHLLNYSGGIRYSHSLKASFSNEKNIRRLMETALTYFDKWMVNNLNTNILLASGVKLHFNYYSDPVEGDTIYHSATRKLTWSDFKSKRRTSSTYVATVMPNFGYDQEQCVENGIIEVTITLKTFLAKSDCWLGTTSLDPSILAHEQKHFDIARLITEQFKNKLLSAPHQPEDYEAHINMQYLDCYRDMNKMQKEYDAQTQHGLNFSAQQDWNKRIDTVLASLSSPDA